MRQRISSVSSVHPPRYLQRRIDRLKFAPSWGQFQIVDLRRLSKATDPDAVGEVRDWSHRWMVRGFWRNQYYPSEDVHRQIYINDYIKGPQDKPLVLKDSVYRLVR